MSYPPTRFPMHALGLLLAARIRDETGERVAVVFPSEAGPNAERAFARLAEEGRRAEEVFANLRLTDAPKYRAAPPPAPPAGPWSRGERPRRQRKRRGW